MAMEVDLEMEDDSCAGELKTAAVAEIEKMIGQVFSADYIEFLRRCNGGSPRKKYFDTQDNSKVVERFLCILDDYKTNPDGAYDVGVVWSQIEDRLNGDLVPFAALFAGDFLCFDYAKDRADPAVVLWNHDLSDEKKPATEAVAGDFQEFLNKLYADGDE